MADVKTIGIAGQGMVGGTLKQYLESKKEELGVEVYSYSLEDYTQEKQVNEADLVFVCVPTPYVWETHNAFEKQGFNSDAIDKVLAKLKDGAIAVIKSTVMIGTTDYFQNKYPKLKLLFNPEFLSESTAWADFTNPDRQFVGYTKESYDVASTVLNILPESGFDWICPAKEAELLKYINNIHGILEVMESNHYYDVCQAEGLDYDRVVKAMTSSKWVGCPMGRHYRVIFHKGYRGVGGTCFPKDLAAWIEYCQKKGIDGRIFETVRKVNQDLLNSQGLTEASSEKVRKEGDLDKLKTEGKI